MSIYNFSPDDAERFAKTNGIAFKKHGDQIALRYCPYCQATNKEDEYKFYISLKTGQFDCKRSSCGARGNMITLSRDFNFSLGRDADTYYRTTDYSQKSFRKFRDTHKQPTDPAVKYMESRGISRETCERYGITTKKDADNVLVFPFRDDKGVLSFIKYRNMEYVKGETQGSKEWCEKDCKPILFGMDQFELSDTVVITEGQIDSLSLSEAGIKNALSVPTGANGFTWVPHCWDFIGKFNRIIVFGDNENGRITLAEEMRKHWPLKVRVVRHESYLGCKDANEILQKHGKQALIDAVENAEAPNNDYLEYLKDVKRLKMSEIPTISTGLKTLDAALEGGFRLGQLAVLTGKRGEGKSTLGSMFGVFALENDYNSLFYSGELEDWMFKEWMSQQIVGKKEPMQSDLDKLDAWLGEKAIIYDDKLAKDDEIQTLIETVETAIIQHNCKFIMIDNLMTAVESDIQSDLYQAQSKFVGDLKALCRRYSVFILLIAHPRKTGANTLDNDDISGSSKITDRADLVMAFGRPDRDEDDEPDHRRLAITKNRLNGRILMGENRIKMVYDQNSRRLAEDTKDFFRKFSFNSIDDDEFYEIGEDDEYIPF